MYVVKSKLDDSCNFKILELLELVTIRSCNIHRLVMFSPKTLLIVMWMGINVARCSM